MFKDKDIDGVLRQIGPLADCFITVTPPSNRGLDNKITQNKCLAYTSQCTCADNMKSAIDQAVKQDYPLIIVCGSLSILDSALKEISQLQDEVKHEKH